ncbi:hypothetical protein HAX54_050760 [Datura stramonium]|uniref:Uncharacterized protein n=1 Tax=Datura stramonium TaxID=4076 RepID=A0ABS8WP05_DATST|nr:hypothetical protein [Datura stramonium]
MDQMRPKSGSKPIKYGMRHCELSTPYMGLTCLSQVSTYELQVSTYKMQAMTFNKKNSDRNARKAISSTKSKDKSKDTSVPTNVEESLHYCVEGMKPYYIKYQDDWAFMPEKSFHLPILKNEFPNINRQFDARD